jgi:hypothetical protein
MAPVFESVADAIGGTPLFRLRGLGSGTAVPVYAKAEFLSVGGSVKDRAALAMVEAAERDGLLQLAQQAVVGTKVIQRARPAVGPGPGIRPRAVRCADRAVAVRLPAPRLGSRPGPPPPLPPVTGRSLLVAAHLATTTSPPGG